MTIITKAQSGLLPATRSSAPGNQTCITGHYFGGDLGFNNEAELFKIIRNIQYADMVNKGYSDVMYNAFPSPFRPAVILGRGLDNRNAANGTTNANLASMSCCLPMGPTLSVIDRIPNGRENLLASCRLFDDMVEQKFGKALPWVGHQFWRPTACPGDWFMNEIRAQFDERKPPAPPTIWYPAPDYRDREIVGYGQKVWDGFADFGYVRWVQMFLNRTSPEGCPVDGVWGPISHDRLLKFQGYFRQVGFPCLVNGITDDPTWATINWIATAEGIV